ncbi:MAG: T9SS type A sorting domain-containing protein [Bacteroides sp.]|nr:T9SS type A sorting domain-containing protein [Bacteroides sp.]
MRRLKTVIFCLLMLIGANSMAQNLTQAEYFIDTDPGVGNATALSITAGEEVNTTFNIPTQGLSPGFHNLFIRFRNANHQWSLAEGRVIYIMAATEQEPVPPLVESEYFFDTDPGAGNGTPISITTDTDIDLLTSIPATGLDPGFHSLFIRFRNEEGQWGIAEGRTLYIQPPGDQTDPPYLSDAEYFFDEDPGIGNGTAIPFDKNNLTLLEYLPIEGLEPGFHNVFFRFQDNHGHWSLYEGRTFYVSTPAEIAPPPLLTAAEYFFDEDPGTGGGTPVDFTAASSVTLNEDIPLGNLPVGSHLLFFRFQNAAGIWGIAEARGFTIGSCVYPQPEFSYQNACANDEVTFTDLSESVETGATYAWDIGNDGSVDYTTVGNITHIFADAGTYEVKLEIFNPSGCSASVIHEIVIHPLPDPPVILAEGPTDICDGQTVYLSVPDLFSTYLWTGGGTTPGVNIGESGEYSVVVTNEFGCAAEAVEPVTVTVYPVYNTSDAETICNGDTYTFGSQELTEAGEYTEVFTTIHGCDSTVVLNLSVIIVDASVTVNSLTITANLAGASYQWIDCNDNNAPIAGETGQSFTATENGSYAVEVTWQGCTATSDCIGITTVGVGPDLIQQQLLIYPNPARDELTIEADFIRQVTIFNHIGQVVYDQRFMTEKRAIADVSQLKQGLYIIRVETQNSTSAKRLSIMH